MIDYVRELVLPADPELAEAIFKEKDRQNTKIELIASENFVSPAVMAAQGSVMTNKYAEGYPGKRYYGGCEFVDIAENLARDRVKKLFGAEHANVQPHSGANANTAVYQAFLQLKTPEQCYRFLQDVCSYSELSAMEQRYNIAEMLVDKRIYTEIMDKTGASSAIISRVSRVLSANDSVLRALLEAEKAADDQN